MKESKTYDELIKYQTYDERLEYLRTNSPIGGETFGCDRYLNQALYKSPEWKSFRNKVIIRDQGCDLGLPGYGLDKREITIHHINPITVDDIVEKRPCVFDMNNVVCVSTNKTHKFIHYGTGKSYDPVPKEREMNDTSPWKRREPNGRK